MTGNPIPTVAPFATHFVAPQPQGAPAQPPGSQPLSPQNRNLASTVGGVNFTPVSEAPLPTALGGPHPLPTPPGPPLPAGFPNPFAITQLQVPTPGTGQAPGAPGAGMPGGGYPPGGMMPPGYGQPPPGYGQPAPGYGQPPPGYGMMPPGYGMMPPGYGMPPMGGGAPAMSQQTFTGPQGNMHGLGNFGPGGASGPLPTPGASAPPPPMPGPMPAFPGNFPMPGAPGPMMAPPPMPGQGMPIPGQGAPLPQQGPTPGAPGGAPNPAADPQLVQKSPYLAQIAWYLLHTPHFGSLMGHAWPHVLQRQDIQHKLLHLTVSQILSPDIQGILREVATGQAEHYKFAQAVASRIKPTLEAVGVLPPGS